MLTKENCLLYVELLKIELVPAMGCTEPISIAYAAAMAKKILGTMPKKAELIVSANIVKNVKSVTVPHTGGMRGLKSAFAAGIIAGNPDVELEVLAHATEEDIVKMIKLKEELPTDISVPEDAHVFEVGVKLYNDEHCSYVRIVDKHTNIVHMSLDDNIIFEKETENKRKKIDRSILNVSDIIEFANSVDISLVKETLDRQIEYNMAIAKEGLTNNYGANVGKTFMNSYHNDVKTLAKAYSAAASDARMNGCEKPVIINSGSGNQGITASVPVIVYADYYKIDKEKLYRALCVSNLITIHLKTGIGTLSAYCGVISAGAGAACGIAYLLGGSEKEIIHTLVNDLAIDSGIICDGAKASCAAKIAMSVESGIFGYELYKNGNQFYGGDGIVKRGVENTIKNVSRLAKYGMRETDKEIIKIMIEE